ncbi:MAG: diacylglycerol kinase family lipid kinase [Armatimonadota bacterium]|nr:diacylglycerol kinase family lipid kinase [Armatimonadota bacterium]MCX7777875.1 diacylglycerol kinase family lipid kinase [Armatimonadota bacterium]MDW8025959.1 diacylglycerol kinase family lipid kinase [Armatimonadota bacterium]
MPRSDVAIVVNPIAGRGKARALAEQLKVELSALGIRSDLLWTAGRGHALALVRGEVSKGAGCIAVCGGDGTVNEVVNALAWSDVPLAILPGGRCNDLARALRIPCSPRYVANSIAKMQTLRIDLGRIGERAFATVATLGFDAEVSRIVSEEGMQIHGTPAYVVAALRLLAKYNFPHVRIEADFWGFSGRILLAATANTPAYGGGMMIAPMANLMDGLLHMCLIKAAPKATILLLFPAVFFGWHRFHSAVSNHPITSVKVDSPQPLWLYADGERIGATPTTIAVMPAALRVIV